MELENFHKNIHEKKFQDAFQYLQTIFEKEKLKTICDIFQKLEFEEIQLPSKFYFLFSKYFIEHGKVKLAEIAVEHYLQDIKVNKRKIVFDRIKNNPEININKNIQKRVLSLGDFFEKSTGVKNISVDDYDDWHFSYWGNNQNHLREEILNTERWDLNLIKSVYEYVLKYGPDEEVLLKIYNNSNGKYKNIFEKYFKEKKISLPKVNADISFKDDLNFDYDQLAFDIISGKMNSAKVEQKTIISSLELIPESDFKDKFHDILIAFKMLNMNDVCLAISKKALSFIDLTDDEILSVKYIQAQCFLEQGDYFEATIAIDEAIANFSLTTEMLRGFLKVKLEIYKLTNKTQEFNELQKMIKKLKSKQN